MKPRRTAHFVDVETGVGGRERDCADSCSSLDEHGRLLQSDGSGGDSDILDWDSDGSDPSSDGEPPSPRGWRPKFSRGGSVALICLLLTLGSFVIPESEDGISTLWHNVLGFGDTAKEHAVHQTSAFIAHIKGRRHCRPAPNPLLKRTERPRVHIWLSALSDSDFTWSEREPHACCPYGHGTCSTSCVGPLSVAPLVHEIDPVIRLQKPRLRPRCDQVHVPGIGEDYVMDPPKERGQWLVAARHDGLLSIMTPVYPDKATLQLLLNQVSFRRGNFRGCMLAKADCSRTAYMIRVVAKQQNNWLF